MEPQFNSAPETGAMAQASEAPQLTMERPVAAVRPEREPEPATQAPVQPVSLPPVQPADPQTPVAPPQQAPSQPVTLPSDEELERAYIEKAREIVARNFDDPYTQSREISRLKAESIKRLHAREVKVEE
jgi:hypothetical protein